MPFTTLARPTAEEHAPYYGRYIALVKSADAVEALITQIDDTSSLLERVDEQRAASRYAPGKWSVKQVVGHLVDAERVFAYRAMRFARADQTELPGFEENDYAENGGFDDRPLADLALELRAVRAASIALFGSLAPEATLRHGTANGTPMSVRALAWTIAGHELHHRSVLIDRYGLR
jgi:uncharacterized damage-inducible protein DinB